MSKLLALVGINVGERRFEAGERFDTADLTDKQVKYLTAEGYAEPIDKGQRVPAETQEAIEKGAPAEDAHPETERIEVEGGQ